MSFSIEYKLEHKWYHICDGIFSEHDANRVAEIFSNHQNVSGTYRIINHYGDSSNTKSVIWYWINGRQEKCNDLRLPFEFRFIKW